MGSRGVSMYLILFAKMFQKLPLSKFAEVAENIGFDGIDLTVRLGGYISPEDVKEKLPEAVEIIKSKGLSIPMITTSITSSREPHAEETFEVASDCGIRFLKLGYWRYEGFGSLMRQIAEIREELKGIQKLSEEYGVTAVLHTHSGMCLTAEPTVLWMIIRDFDPDLIGAYIDPGHMVVEGGLAGWLMGIDILADYIRVVAVKDFAWFKEESWRVKVVPLGEGLVPWRKVFEILKAIGFKGPVSIHCEYEDLTISQLINRAESDLRYLKEILRSLESL